MHGHVRTTQDVDILLTRAGLVAFKDGWLGQEWVEIFPGSKGVRDTRTGVRIDILIAGDYPGDGQSKPVRFPDPGDLDSNREPVDQPVIPLRILIELKLAIGMTAPHRLQDLADVIQLIRVNQLTPEYVQEIDPYVHAKYLELWQAAQVSEDY